MEKQIQARLFAAFVLDGPMSQALYEWEMEENLAYWRKGMLRDKEDFLIAVTENSGDVAMIIIEKKGKVLVNEEARRWLRRKWKAPGVYTNNMALFIPDMARQLHEGNFWTMGVLVLPDAIARAVRAANAKGPKWLE